MTDNPLDTPGTPFTLGLYCVDPRLNRLKDKGPVARVKFEVTREGWLLFDRAQDTAGLIVEGRFVVGDSDQGHELTFWNPNPKATRVQGGSKYTLDVEVDRDTALWFMDWTRPEDPIGFRGLVERDGYHAPQTRSRSKGPYGHLAKELERHGFFRNPNVWAAVGSDRQYQEWCRRQPCVVCGDYDYDPDTGQAHTEFAHVRRAANSGTAYKPEYSGVPMCHAHHALQHGVAGGEAEAFLAHVNLRAPNHPQNEVGPDKAKEWFDQQAIEHLRLWSREKLKGLLGYASWAEVPPAELMAWSAERDLAVYLPSAYKEAAIDEGMPV